jgi:GNAT superfamily N-acetyltransferase
LKRLKDFFWRINEVVPVDIQFEEATEVDIPKLTEVMTRAFDDDTRKHLGKPKGGPDGYDTGDFFRKWMLSYTESKGFKILVNGKIVGGFIVWVFEHGNNKLGTIFVDPDMQNQGVGSQAMHFIFTTFLDAKSWTLETPSWAVKNHYFYEKNGFQKIREKLHDRENLDGTSFLYRKIMNDQ